MHGYKERARRERRRATRLTQDSEAITELVDAIQSQITELNDIGTQQPTILTPTHGCFGSNTTRVEVELNLPDGWSGSISAVAGGDSLRNVSATIDQEKGDSKHIHTFSYDAGQIEYDSILLE